MIHQFSPVIYPFKLWVGIDVPAHDIIADFYGYDKSRGEVSDFTEDELNKATLYATTYPVVHKDSGLIGCFVHFHSRRYAVPAVMAHEASHVSDFISDKFGLASDASSLFDEGEARAYIVQWAVECMEKVRKGKTKEIKEDEKRKD